MTANAGNETSEIRGERLPRGSREEDVVEINRRGGRPCNLCGSTDFKSLFRSVDYPDRWESDVLRCRTCSLVFRTGSAFRQLTQPGDAISRHRLDHPDELTPGKRSVFHEYLRAVASFRGANRILDVGSGEGFFLGLCVEQGWEAWGVELVPELAATTKRIHGIDVFQGSFEEADFSDDFFDVVTFWNVLDHLIDPDLGLQKAWRILRPGGAIFLRVPNASFHIPTRWLYSKFYRLWKGMRGLDVTAIHLYSLNQQTIRRYLRKNGFEQITVQNGLSSWRGDREAYGRLSPRAWMELFTTFLAEVCRIVSLGHWLVAPSLFGRAIKGNASPASL